MGTAFLHGNGGSGDTGLNFNIVGDTAPKSANKNMLLIDVPTKTVNGLKFTVNSDGSVTVDGTASAGAEFRLSSYPVTGLLQNGETYTLKSTGNSDIAIGIHERTSENAWVKTHAQEYNANVVFTYKGVSESGNRMYVYLYVRAGKTLSSVKVYPQLEKGFASTSFVNGTAAVNTIWVNTDKAVHAWDFSATQPYLRSKNKNLIVYPLYQTTRTENGITFTDNKNGTVTANGTATAEAVFNVTYCWDNISTIPLIKGRTYSVSGCPSGGSSSTYLIQAVYRSESGTSSYATDTGNGFFFTANDKRVRVGFRIIIKSGTKVSNLVFKPQLELGAIATSFVKGDATGQVWISIGTSSKVSFNALKKNRIDIYPIKAKQYINGAWVEKTAKSYQGGVWVDWIYELYLYNKGTISSEAGTLSTTSVKYGGNAGSCTFNQNTSNVTIGTLSNSGALVYFTTQIDLTDYSTLCFVGSVVDKNTGSTSERCGIGVWKSIPTSNAATEASAIMEGFRASGTHTLDIKNCTGKHYIGIAVHGLGTTENPYLLATMDQMYLK